MQQQRRGLWPYLSMVACLAAMAAVASWWSWPPSAPVPTARQQLPVLAAASPNCGEAEPRAISEGRVRSDSLAALRTEELFAEFAVARQHMRPAAPVADRITIDPSLTQTPLLPNIKPSREGGGAVRAEAPIALGTPAVGDPSVRVDDGGLASTVVRSACWPLAGQLVNLLEGLQEDIRIRDWSVRVEQQLTRLHAADSLGSSRAGTVLQQLQQLAHEGRALAEAHADPQQRAAVMRATFALQRRLAIWQPVHTLALPHATQVSLRDGRSAADLHVKLRAAEEQLELLTHPEQWREYLMIEQLTRAASPRWPMSAPQRSRLAREFLERLESSDATTEQAQFFQHSAWRELADALRSWVCEPVDYQALLEDVERIEWNNGQRVSSDLASHYQALRWSADPELVDLADRINIYYRNANVRLAISADLLNQLLPHDQSMDEAVNDQLMGGRVFGRSRVTTRLRLVLMPDRERWRMGLEAQGDVNSRTQTKRGPARFHNAGRSHYLARKLLLIDRRGVHTGDAEATALTDADLTGMETDLDGVPLVNLLVRTLAKQAYDRQADEAQREAQGLLAARAESRLNQEVDEKLGAATSRFRREIWNPLRDLGLDPEAVDMETTTQRLIARYRLAGTDQVAAFTPRPQAPANSWLSIQLHESMLNNVIGSLQLGGREMRLREMFLEVARKLNRTQYRVPDDVPEDVTIELAEHDPVRFECTDNRLHIVLRIHKLATDAGAQWDDFQVRGMYLPLVEGIHVGLQRDGYVHLKGELGRLPLRDQVALRTIFTKVLAAKPDFDLLANILANDGRLQDLGVNQFVIHNGWLAIAIGPRGPATAHLTDESETLFAR